MSEKLNDLTRADSDLTIYCNQCFTQMNQTSKSEWICPECGNHGYLDDPDDMETFYYEHVEDDTVDIIENIPEGCRACGSDMYPHCLDSCALMDD